MELEDILVLLVEPSSTQQRIIAEHFNTLGVGEVQGAATGQEAIDLMHRMHPDLVVSSMYLPDMNGTEVVHAMRESDDLKETAYMLVSSETNHDALDPVRQAGVVAILPKPFSIKDLQYALNATLDYYNPKHISLDSEAIEDLRVLIVDDSNMARKHIRRVLSKMGMEEFTEVENGKLAVEVLHTQYFDLVVTDYNMPEMDGAELVNYIRNSSEHSTVPILMVTSEDAGSRLSAVKKSGVSAICDKPFETGMVKSLLEQMLS